MFDRCMHSVQRAIAPLGTSKVCLFLLAASSVSLMVGAGGPGAWELAVSDAAFAADAVGIAALCLVSACGMLPRAIEELRRVENASRPSRLRAVWRPLATACTVADVLLCGSCAQDGAPGMVLVLLMAVLASLWGHLDRRDRWAALAAILIGVAVFAHLLPREAVVAASAPMRTVNPVALPPILLAAALLAACAPASRRNMAHGYAIIASAPFACQVVAQYTGIPLGFLPIPFAGTSPGSLVIIPVATMLLVLLAACPVMRCDPPRSLPARGGHGRASVEGLVRWDASADGQGGDGHDGCR